MIPPYNTGNNDFVYNDTQKSNEIGWVNNDDPFRHSKWLSFMKRRLLLAKELLTNDGVIFVSIDDNEQAYLKVLMDEIFGNNNFITSFIWERTHHSNKNNSGKKVFRNADYIHVFSKNFEKLNFFNEGIKINFEDAPLLNKSNNLKKITFPKNKVYFKEYNKFNDEEIIVELNSRWSQSKINDEINLGATFIIKSNNWKAIRVVYSNNKKGYKLPHQLMNSSITFTDDFKYPTTETGTSTLNNLLGISNFAYPKPHQLLQYLIKLLQKPNAVVLDFFAGSGTTGHAVMQLNQEDGGNRKFILVTNNEWIDKKRNKKYLQKYGENFYIGDTKKINTRKFKDFGICQRITYERLYRIIKGKTTKGHTDYPWIKDHDCYDENLLYLEIDGDNNKIDKFNGEYEDLDQSKDLYKNEFDCELDIKTIGRNNK